MPTEQPAAVLNEFEIALKQPNRFRAFRQASLLK